MEEHYNETFKTWNKMAALYEEKFMDIELYNESYIHFCSELANENSTILEIGCGPGNIAKFVQAQKPLAKISAIDISENMIQLAKRNVPTANFNVMDGRNIDKIKNKYDGILCGFIIPYLDEIECSKFLSNAINLLNEKGMLYLSFVNGEYANSGFIAGSSGDRTYFYYHDLQEIKTDIEKKGMNILGIEKLEYHKTQDELEIHTVIIAKLR